MFSPEGPQRTKAPTTAATVTPAATIILSLSIDSKMMSIVLIVNQFP